MGELILALVVIVGGVFLLHLLAVFLFFVSRHSAIDPPPRTDNSTEGRASAERQAKDDGA